MEIMKLATITIHYQQRSQELLFTSAELILITDYGSRLWYVDVNGVTDLELLRWFGQSEDIRVELSLQTEEGQVFNGTAYLHPNELHQAAALRGEGELLSL